MLYRIDSKSESYLKLLAVKNATLSNLIFLTDEHPQTIASILLALWKGDFIAPTKDVADKEHIRYDTVFTITAGGRAYLEAVHKNKLEKIADYVLRILPIIISTIALAISAYSLGSK